MKASANPLHQKLVAEILAVDNFSAFKKLMQKRNKEMNGFVYEGEWKADHREGKGEEIH